MAAVNGELEKKNGGGGGGGVSAKNDDRSGVSSRLTEQRVDVLIKAISNLLALDPKPEKEGDKEESKKSSSFKVSTYISKIDKLIDRIDELSQNELLSEDALGKFELYRGRLEERISQLSEYIDLEEGGGGSAAAAAAADASSNELAVQRRELLMDDVDNFLRTSALNVPTNRRQALIDKGDRYIERLENLGYFHLQDAETLKSIRNYKRDIQKLISELCRGADSPTSRGNTSWSSDSNLNEQRMEILFRDIEQFVAVPASNISVSRRYATVQKGDKLIEKLLQYGYYQVLDKETLQTIQNHKQNLEQVCNELSKLIDEQPPQNNFSGFGGGGGYRRQHSGVERQHSSGFDRQHSSGFDRY